MIALYIILGITGYLTLCFIWGFIIAWFETKSKNKGW